jgi:Rieske Fe-S protein
VNESRDSRRSALASLVVAGLGVITAALAGLVGLVATPRAAGPAKRWRKALSVFDLSSGGPTSAVIAERHADGWYETRKQSVIFIDKDGDNYRALSAICQHLGCRVHWEPSAQQFKCPCHGGVYDREGRVVSGPPPRPLERLNVRVNPQTSDIEVEL